RKIISYECMELPHIDYGKQHGDPDYKYVYACGVDSARPEGFYNQLVKINVETGQHMKWSQPGCYPGEPVFISSPTSSTQDDGVLLSVVLNPSENNSFLLVLDANDMTELARASVPHTIPFGYHGTFIQTQQQNA
ncbi:MAG: carotenoid oxygenase family protein, partial [Bacteroidota bacterium]